MPIESVGVDVKMLAVDMDPKTYSPMSGSDENMSSPPSVLTTASAGSCTPSSLPSAGSTPSSIPSAGSTPYQFVSQEESTVIKPLTPSDHQSIHPSTPDQPVTPEPTIASDLHGAELNDIGRCKKNLISGIDNTECFVSPSNERTMSDDVNERRQDCPCIMCEDKQSSQVSPCKNPEEQSISKLPASISKPKTKIKSPKFKDGESKSWRKSRLSNKNHHYQSEISGDSESTGIKIKIKRTLTASAHTEPKPTIASELSVSDSSLNSLNLLPNSMSCTMVKSPVKAKKNMKRKSSEITSISTASKNTELTKKKRSKSKSVDNSVKWGPPPSSVDGETQSDWACKIPTEVLERIFLFATYSQGCIPFLLRMSRVCRSWRDASLKRHLWHSIDLSTNLIKNRSRTDKPGWTEAITPIMLRRISELCPDLHSLNLSYCYKLHAENIHSLLFSSTNLKRLDLSNIMGTHKPTPRCAVGQQTLSELASSLGRNITHLAISNNTLSNVPFIINSLSEHCSQLQELDLSNVETVGRDNVRLDIEKLQNGCPLLRILRLANTLFCLSSTPMSVQASSPGFPELEELSIAVDGRENAGINDSELERILKNSNKLRLLDVRGCHNITDSSLVRIHPWDLEHLFLSGGVEHKFYSDRLELVIRKWQHSLVELDLSWTANSAAIDAALFALAEEENKTLQVLNLRGSSISFEPVRKILSNCANLRLLNLTSCRALPRGVKRLHETARDVMKLKDSIDIGRYDEALPET
ncbi:F-box/LRR-repeat protein 6 [Armadillidium vulgare]|nr:F-box/LRR-repeat protein 6 [Armadillidium vulgare]